MSALDWKLAMSHFPAQYQPQAGVRRVRDPPAPPYSQDPWLVQAMLLTVAVTSLAGDCRKGHLWVTYPLPPCGQLGALGSVW